MKKINKCERISLVTGSSRGIGKAIALRLSERGDRVLLNYKEDITGIEALVSELEQKNKNFDVFRADVANLDDVKSVFENIQSKYGKLDVLVNNAGVADDKTLHKMSPDQWHKVISTDLNSVFYCTAEAVKLMRQKRYGKIVTISSVVGMMGNFGQSNYAAAKAGIIGFTKSVATENASKNITVNAVCPGFIKTAMTDKIPKDILESIEKKIPIGRLGKPEEVAELVEFLTSDRTNYITGETIVIDGGLISRGFSL